MKTSHLFEFLLLELVLMRLAGELDENITNMHTHSYFSSSSTHGCHWNHNSYCNQDNISMYNIRNSYIDKISMFNNHYSYTDTISMCNNCWMSKDIYNHGFIVGYSKQINQQSIESTNRHVQWERAFNCTGSCYRDNDTVTSSGYYRMDLDVC